MVVDVHAHIYPEKLAARALRQIATFYGMEERAQQPPGVGTAAYLLERGAACGIGRTLVCEVAHRPGLVEPLNRFLLDTCRASGGRLLPLCAIHPGCSDSAGILRRARDSGFCGAKLHPDYQGFDMDSPACAPIYAFCQEYHFPILMHCGDARLDHSAPFRLQRVLERFPALPVVAAHLGGYQRWGEALDLRPAQNLYFDVSSSLFALRRDEVMRFFDKFGPGRFLFGSDYPLFDPAQELARFYALGLEEGAARLVAEENYKALFPAAAPQGEMQGK